MSGRRRLTIQSSSSEEEVLRLPPPENQIPPPQERQPRPARQPLTDEVEPQEWDRRRFPRQDVQTRYFQLQRTRSVIPERGVGQDYFNDDRLQAILQWLGWERLVAHPTSFGSVKLVLEILAQLHRYMEAEQNLRIRGRRFRLSEEIINEFLGIREPEDVHYGEIHSIDGEPIGRALCDGNLVLNRNNPNEFQTKNITTPWKELALIWLSRVQPTVRDHTISFSRAQYIHGIGHGERPNIGRLIFNSIKNTVSSARASIAHVHLLTEMCRQQGIPISDEECTLRPDGAIKIIGYGQRKADLHSGRILPAVVVSPDEIGRATEYILQQPPIPMQAAHDFEAGTSNAPPPRRRRRTPTPPPPPPPQQGQIQDLFEQFAQFRVEYQNDQRMVRASLLDLNTHVTRMDGTLTTMQNDYQTMLQQNLAQQRNYEAFLRGMRQRFPDSFGEYTPGPSDPHPPNWPGGPQN